MGIDYKKSGVDIEAGDALVDWLKKDEKSHSSVIDGIGGFASLFRFPKDQYENPCLVSCTDGVGTKVLLASHFEKFDTIGQDLVAMCVNDLICTGGDPLFFLDYYATGKLHLPWAQEFLKGVRKACADSNCLLVGGETAEMPGVYAPTHFDCAGFSVGVVDEHKRFGAHNVKNGDAVIGIASSGFHSNGYSLLRNLMAPEIERKDEKWKNILLKPTHLYVDVVQKLKKQVKIHAVAHITGGGVQNIDRVLPENLKWQPNSTSSKIWDWPEEYLEIQKRSQMSDEKMLETLNCGIGLVVVLPSEHKAEALKIIQKSDFKTFELGQMVSSAT